MKQQVVKSNNTFKTVYIEQLTHNVLYTVTVRGREKCVSRRKYKRRRKYKKNYESNNFTA